MAKSHGVAIRLVGSLTEDTASVLVDRLRELGRRTEWVNAETAGRLGAGAGFACQLLVRNGVFVVVSEAGVHPECDARVMELDPNDTPEFAAEKVLDVLAEEGLVALELDDYSPEEEEQVRQRLSDLGYIE